MKKILLETERTGYNTDQCSQTVTIGELIEILKYYDSESLLYLSNDNGYTFGSINEESFREEEEEEEDEIN